MPEPEILLRDPQPGDMGWVVQQQGEPYQEFGQSLMGETWEMKL